MAAGLQVWGPDGSLWVDTTTFLGRIYGIQMSQGGGSIACNLQGLGTPFGMWPMPVSDSFSDNNGNSFSAPVVGGITFSNNNNTLNVNFGFSGNSTPNAPMYYGAW